MKMTWRYFRNGKFYYGMDLPSADQKEDELFTGLTDRNGKEVFEGDILKVREMTGVDSYEDILREPVKLVDGCFVCGDYISEWTMLCRWIRGGKLDAEVVGNRWENPELMELFAYAHKKLNEEDI